MGKRLSRGDRNIRWIEDYCRVPEGKFVGQKMRLRAFQKREIKRIYDNPHGTRLAIISVGKKNAKTTLAACLLLLHLAGPEAVRNSQLPSTAQSKEQASVLFKLAAKMVRMSSDLSDCVTIRDTAKELLCPEIGTFYKALSAEVSTAHGQSPIFAVHDELGQVRGPVSELYNAIENAMGAHERPLSIIISTQAPSDGDLLSILIDDAIAGHDPHTVISLYTADTEIDPFSIKAMKQANPAYGDFLNAREVQKQADEAKRMPSQEPLYRNYQLNQRVQVSNPFIARTVWAANGDAPDLDFTGRDVWGGLDLAQRGDTSALVWAADGDKLDIMPRVWLPAKDIRERSRLDRVPYDVWEKEGHLLTTPGPTVSYKAIAEEIMRARAVWNVRSIAFDPNMAEALWPWLETLGMTETEREALFHKVQQGYAGMSPCIGELQSLLLEEKIRHGNHPVLTMHAVNAVLHRGSVSDQFLLKKPSAIARIDSVVALSMAVGRRAMMIEEPVPMTPWDLDPGYRLAG